MHEYWAEIGELGDFPDHRLSSDREVIVYRDVTLPIEWPRIQRITLRELATVPLTTEEIVVLPPAVILQLNPAMIERLKALDKVRRWASGPESCSTSGKAVPIPKAVQGRVP